MNVVAYRPCGCMCFASAQPDKKDAVRLIEKAQRGELRVDTATTEQVRAATWGCPKCEPDLSTPDMFEAGPVTRTAAEE